MKKVITFAIFLLISLSLYAGPFSDVPQGHWAYDAVSKLVNKGIVKGYPDNTFKVGKNVTRYEIAMIIARVMGEIKNGVLVNPGDTAALEKLKVEFHDELELHGVKVTARADDARARNRDIEMFKKVVAEHKKHGEEIDEIYHNGKKYTYNGSIDDFEVSEWKSGSGRISVFTNNNENGHCLFIFIDKKVKALAKYIVRGRRGHLSHHDRRVYNETYFVKIDRCWKKEDYQLMEQGVVSKGLKYNMIYLKLVLEYNEELDPAVE